jgi:hypothetical protein
MTTTNLQLYYNLRVRIDASDTALVRHIHEWLGARFDVRAYREPRHAFMRSMLTIHRHKRKHHFARLEVARQRRQS